LGDREREKGEFGKTSGKKNTLNQEIFIPLPKTLTMVAPVETASLALSGDDTQPFDLLFLLQPFDLLFRVISVYASSPTLMRCNKGNTVTVIKYSVYAGVSYKGLVPPF